MGKSISRKKMPPWYGVPSGPVIVARHFIMSSECGPALQLDGGSLTSSASSFWIRLVMLILVALLIKRRILLTSSACICYVYCVFCISIFLLYKIEIKKYIYIYP